MSTVFMYFMPILPFFAALASFVSTWGHLLSTLLALEFMVLALFFSLLSANLSLMQEMFISFFFISVAVCEGALGLAILVLFSRSKGEDLLSSTSLMAW